ncbi:MAG: hypothetical protein S4CHLAM123_12910 [Chlamydiales bacterium]|nr:hypothetical protein [Chlamydiales bacterium]
MDSTFFRKSSEYIIQNIITNLSKFGYMQRSQIETAFSEEATVESISSEQSHVLYIAEIRFKSADKIVRLYCSSNQLYWAIVAGDDLMLASDFFDTIQIKK